MWYFFYLKEPDLQVSITYWIGTPGQLKCRYSEKFLDVIIVNCQLSINQNSFGITLKKLVYSKLLFPQESTMVILLLRAASLGFNNILCEFCYHVQEEQGCLVLISIMLLFQGYNQFCQVFYVVYFTFFSKACIFITLNK